MGLVYKISPNHNFILTINSNIALKLILNNSLSNKRKEASNFRERLLTVIDKSFKTQLQNNRPNWVSFNCYDATKIFPMIIIGVYYC